MFEDLYVFSQLLVFLGLGIWVIRQRVGFRGGSRKVWLPDLVKRVAKYPKYIALSKSEQQKALDGKKLEVKHNIGRMMGSDAEGREFTLTNSTYWANINDLMPPWADLKFHFSDRGRDSKEERLARCLFGEDILKAIDEELTLKVKDGCLTLVSERWPGRYSKRVDEQLTQLCFALALSFLERKRESFPAFLRGEVSKGDGAALELLLQNFSESAETKEALASARASEAPSLLYIVAMHDSTQDEEEGSHALVSIATDESASENIRRRSAQEILRRKEVEGLIGLGIAAPQSVQKKLIKALSVYVRPDVEEVLIDYLKSKDDDIVEAASDALARVGTKDAIMPLKSALQPHVSEELRISLDIAIECIQARISGGEKGGLSVVEQSGDQGQLSLSDEQRGRLALKQTNKT